MPRCSYVDAIAAAGVLVYLQDFDPHVAGTLPLGLGLPTSDVDVLCHAPDPVVFSSVVWHAFRHQKRFAMLQWIDRGCPIIASFEKAGWPFEIFGSVQPVHEQPAWQHLLVERRLLALGKSQFRAAVMRDRAAGQKTEPAFAAALGLPGDPYVGMLQLAGRSDAELADLVAAAGFAAGRGRSRADQPPSIP